MVIFDNGSAKHSAIHVTFWLSIANHRSFSFSDYIPALLIYIRRNKVVGFSCSGDIHPPVQDFQGRQMDGYQDQFTPLAAVSMIEATSAAWLM